jgi:hypothetical protein
MAQIRWRRAGDQVTLAILEPEEIIAELGEQNRRFRLRCRSMTRFAGLLMAALTLMTVLAILGWLQIWGWL